MPASFSRSMAVSSARIASVASDRTAMIASSAPIAKAAIRTPSRTPYGFRSRSVRSVCDDGSAP